MSARFPTFYLSHGGGPWPYMDEEARLPYAKLEASLRELPRQLPEKPEAILIVSGHWDERDFAVIANAAPPNLRRFFGPRVRRDDSLEFDAWLRGTLTESAPARRLERLTKWEQAPSAREAHPREDHLMPLHVVVGAAEEEAGRTVYGQEDFLGTIALSSYRFG